MDEVAAGIPTDVSELQKRVSELTNLVEKQQQEIKEHYKNYLDVHNKYMELRDMVFGQSSEKLSDEDKKQIRLFNEAEDGLEENDEPIIAPSESETITYTRKKPRGRKPIPEDYPCEEVLHKGEEHERFCPYCHKERPITGSEESKEIEHIPAKMIVHKHIRLKYGSCDCEAFRDSELPEVVTASAPPRMLPGSIAGPGMLATVLTNKFVDALPFYRQENIFRRLGFSISRATMCNWAIGVANRCEVLIQMMWVDIMRGELINMDETTLQVLKEPGRTAAQISYMWVNIGYYDSGTDHPIVIFHYHKGRSREIPYTLLKNFEGFLQTDGYAGYDKTGELPKITHVGCWAHARRKFKQAAKVSKKVGSAEQGLSWIGKLYRIEKALRSDDTLIMEQFEKKRTEQVKPVLASFKKWLDRQAQRVPPESPVGKAVKYTLGQWDKLERYHETGICTPDNNVAENAIRPFVIGRKNYLFSNTPRGAHSSAAIYSLVETAKANQLEPYQYLRYLFRKLPSAKTEEEIRRLMPYHLSPEAIADP